MQEIKAYVRNNMLDHVIDSLAALPGMPGIAVVPVQMFGHTVEHEQLVDLEMIKLELNVTDELAEQVIQTLLQHASTGKGHHGDGHIFVNGVGQAIRIADGVRDYGR